MISGAASPKYIFGSFYDVLTRGNNFHDLSIAWIASGFVLMLIGVFGIWSALKESIFMVNLVNLLVNRGRCAIILTKKNCLLKSTPSFCL